MIFNVKVPAEFDNVRVENALRCGVRAMLMDGLKTYRYEFPKYTPDYNLIINFEYISFPGQFKFSFKKVYLTAPAELIQYTHVDNVIRELLTGTTPQSTPAEKYMTFILDSLTKTYDSKPFNEKKNPWSIFAEIEHDLDRDLRDIPSFWRNSLMLHRTFINASDLRRRYEVRHYRHRTDHTLHGYYCECDAYKYSKGSTVFEKKPCKHIRQAIKEIRFGSVTPPFPKLAIGFNPNEYRIWR